jgi:hypothetical protein
LFYPGGDEALNSLKDYEARAIQTAIDFLEADPLHHRSGYTKEEVWKRLRNASLHANDKARLEAISLRYLERKIGRDFWSMARVMSYLATEAFWKRLHSELETAEEPKKTRVLYLLAYEQGAAAGGEIRRTLARERMMARYRERQSRI